MAQHPSEGTTMCEDRQARLSLVLLLITSLVSILQVF